MFRHEIFHFVLLLKAPVYHTWEDVHYPVLAITTKLIEYSERTSDKFPGTT